MGRIVGLHLPCDLCNSSDAMCVYEDGSTYCFSCNTSSKGQAGNYVGEETPFEPSNLAITDLPIRGFQDRKITRVVCEFFGVRSSYKESDGTMDAHYYPYEDVNGAIAYKVRKLPKSFHWEGARIKAPLFGRHLFGGGGTRLVIVEGEIDALSVAQAMHRRYNRIYPVVALPGASFAMKMLQHRDWLTSFEKVVIMMDDDEAGHTARDQLLKIVGYERSRLVTYPPECKDANDILMKYGAQRLNETIWDAEAVRPDGILMAKDLWGKLVEYSQIESIPYPECLNGIQSKTKGIRKGEITLFTSGTGSGKSTMLREIILHLLQETEEDLVGIVSLEEAPEETAKKLACMYLHVNPSVQEETIPLENIKVGFDALFESNRVVILDHKGSVKDGSIIDRLEYMALMGCKYVVLDHITILVSEGADGLTGNEAIDKVMNDLLRLVQKHKIWLGLVSHLRKTPNQGRSFEEGRLPSLDDIKGSGSIKQIAYDIIGFARNTVADNDAVRNTINIRVLKCRHTGLTGGVQSVYYNPLTGRLELAGGDKFRSSDEDDFS